MFVKNRFSYALLDVDEIYSIKKDKRKIYVSTHEGSYWQYAGMNHFIPGSEENFHRCHSFLTVNLDKISVIDGKGVTLKNGQILTMCRASIQQTRKVWNRYIRENIIDDRNDGNDRKKDT